jgi:hypothetical protein
MSEISIGYGNPKNFAAPTTYLKRVKGARQKNGHLVGWSSYGWGTLNAGVKTFADAEKIIVEWNSYEYKNNKTFSTQWEYSLPLHCERCYTVVQETFPSIGLEAGIIGKHVCNKCHQEGLGLMQKQKQNAAPPTFFWEPAKKPTLVRKEGDIWKLPKASSPMWTEQWGYQGSAKTPYVVSHRSENANGSTTEDGWACSCANFTRHTPRTKCKHILNVMLKEGMAVKSATAKIANVDQKKLAAFEKWEKEQAALKSGAPAPTAGVKLNIFGATGRKFR